MNRTIADRYAQIQSMILDHEMAGRAIQGRLKILQGECEHPEMVGNDSRYQDCRDCGISVQEWIKRIT